MNLFHVPADAKKIEYHAININKKWRVAFIKENIDSNHNQFEILNITKEDLVEILKVLCIS